MIKSVCSVGYSAAQLFTRSAVFALLTGGKKIVPYESAGDVPSDMYDIALFNAQTGIAEAGISFGELQKKKCMPVVYSDEPLNRLLLQMFASDDRCSIVMCIGSREAEECRACLERAQPYRSVAAQNGLNKTLPRIKADIKSFTRQQLLSLFCVLQCLTVKEAAAVLETSEKSARTLMQKVRHSFDSDGTDMGLVQSLSWIS